MGFFPIWFQYFSLPLERRPQFKCKKKNQLGTQAHTDTGLCWWSNTFRRVLYGFWVGSLHRSLCACWFMVKCNYTYVNEICVRSAKVCHIFVIAVLFCIRDTFFVKHHISLLLNCMATRKLKVVYNMPLEGGWLNVLEATTKSSGGLTKSPQENHIIFQLIDKVTHNHPMECMWPLQSQWHDQDKQTK